MYSPIHRFPMGSGCNRGDFRGYLGKVLYTLDPVVQKLFLIQISSHPSKLTWRKGQIDASMPLKPSLPLFLTKREGTSFKAFSWQQSNNVYEK